MVDAAVVGYHVIESARVKRFKEINKGMVDAAAVGYHVIESARLKRFKETNKGNGGRYWA